MSIPTFKGSSINKSASQKIQDIKDKTQLFLSKKISPEFIKRILKPGDSIEFNYELVIDESGHPVPNRTKVKTESSYFNLKMIRYLNILPKFTPAISTVTEKPYHYFNSMDAEFLINDAYKLIPIYRINLSGDYEIDTDDESIISLYDSINKNATYEEPIKNTVYFSTTKNKKITNVKVFTDNLRLKKIITSSIQSIEANNSNDNSKFYLKLKKNKNYSLTTHTYKQQKGNISITLDQQVIYQGCNENLNNIQLKKCASEKISRLINKNFNTDLVSDLGLIGRQEILITFKIDTNGNIVNVRARAPHHKLKEEAIRVIKLIPKMKPALLKGEPITMPFSFPLVFVIES